MRITIDIEPADESDEMAQFTFKRTGETRNMAVLRATARMMRAIGLEFSNLQSESDYIKEHICETTESEDT